MMNWKITKDKLNFLTPKHIIEKIWEDEVRISLFLLACSFFMINIPTISSGGRFLQNPFWDNIIANANTLVLDIFIMLFLNTYFRKRMETQREIKTIEREKQREIKRLEDEIDDFRGWDSEEASRRIRGIIVRLNKLGVTRINLSLCSLRNVDLRGAQLTGARLDWAKLSNTNLVGANLVGADFTGAILIQALLMLADLTQADFKAADLDEADFTAASFCCVKNISQTKGLESANFTNTILDEETRKFLAKINKTVKSNE